MGWLAFTILLFTNSMNKERFVCIDLHKQIQEVFLEELFSIVGLIGVGDKWMERRTEEWRSVGKMGM